MYSALKEFIEKNKDLIEEADWASLFAKAVQKGVYFCDLVTILHQADIDDPLVNEHKNDPGLNGFIYDLQEVIDSDNFYKLSTIQPNNAGYLKAARLIGLDVYSVIGDDKIRFLFDRLPNATTFMITYKDYPIDDLINNIKRLFVIPSYVDISEKNFRKVDFT